VLRICEFLALFCSALFAGAALCISLVEHPARLSRETRVAFEVWAPSYQRATLLQAPLAVLACLGALGAGLLGGGLLWLLAGVLIGSVVPFTFLGIFPTNRALLEPGRDTGSPETRELLRRWGRLHTVRTVLGVLALALMCWIVKDS
jgi:hypothetical protein